MNMTKLMDDDDDDDGDDGSGACGDIVRGSKMTLDQLFAVVLATIRKQGHGVAAVVTCGLD